MYGCVACECMNGMKLDCLRPNIQYPLVLFLQSNVLKAFNIENPVNILSLLRIHGLRMNPIHYDKGSRKTRLINIQA